MSPRPFDYESNALTKLSHSGKLRSVQENFNFCNIYSIHIKIGVIYEDNSRDFFINLLVDINAYKIIYKILKNLLIFLVIFIYDIVWLNVVI